MLNEDRIQPLAENPYYWQYKDEPVFLIGGSWQDILFNQPTKLEEHFDMMQSVGGNYFFLKIDNIVNSVNLLAKLSDTATLAVKPTLK